MNKEIFFIVSPLKTNKKNQRISSCNVQAVMIKFWNQHWISISILSTIDLISASVPVITLAETSLTKTCSFLCIPEKIHRLTCCSKFLGFRIPLSKKESAQLFNRCFKGRNPKEIEKVLHKTHRGSPLPWEETPDVLFKPGVDSFSQQKCSHLGKILSFSIKLLLCISNTVLCAQCLQ